MWQVLIVRLLVKQLIKPRVLKATFSFFSKKGVPLITKASKVLSFSIDKVEHPHLAHIQSFLELQHNTQAKVENVILDWIFKKKKLPPKYEMYMSNKDRIALRKQLREEYKKFNKLHARLKQSHWIKSIAYIPTTKEEDYGILYLRVKKPSRVNPRGVYIFGTGVSGFKHNCNIPFPRKLFLKMKRSDKYAGVYFWRDYLSLFRDQAYVKVVKKVNPRTHRTKSHYGHLETDTRVLDLFLKTINIPDDRPFIRKFKLARARAQKEFIKATESYEIFKSNEAERALIRKHNAKMVKYKTNTKHVLHAEPYVKNQIKHKMIYSGSQSFQKKKKGLYKSWTTIKKVM